MDLPLMGVLVILLESLITGPIARRVMRKHFDPAKDKPIFCTLAVQWMTVTLMCPMMSLAATLIFKQPGWETPAVFLQTFACNFPAALLWQLFFCRAHLPLAVETGVPHREKPESCRSPQGKGGPIPVKKEIPPVLQRTVSFCVSQDFFGFPFVPDSSKTGPSRR